MPKGVSQGIGSKELHELDAVGDERAGTDKAELWAGGGRGGGGGGGGRCLGIYER